MLTEPPVYRLKRGNAPLVVSMPHAGTVVPEWLQPRLRPEALNLPDTDWHLDRLYSFLGELDVTCITANYSRYVIDLNRPQDDASLYPGQNTTGLCPLESFEGQPLYKRDSAPDTAEILARVDAYWRPYHRALVNELARLKEQHDQVVLWDAHSIRSYLPRFFDGELPCLNLGTAGGAACAAEIASCAVEQASGTGYSWVLNGRFQGGYVTRHYGNPSAGIHAIQMEISQRAYMRESRHHPEFDDAQAAPLRGHLRTMLEALIAQMHRVEVL